VLTGKDVETLDKWLEKAKELGGNRQFYKWS